MTGIPLELQVEKRREGKKREEGKPNEKAALIYIGQVM